MEDNMSHPSRPQMFLFGCTLKSDKKEFKVEIEDDDTEHQLSLKSVCLGAEADDMPHTVEIEGLTFDGKKTKVPLVVLKPSILPSVSLGGFEVSPPVVFRLQSGSGPVHISGQHFVIVKESEDEEEEEEEENNSSPVKRPSALSSRKQPTSKKLKMESDEEEEEEEEDDDDSDEDEDDEDDDEDSDEEDVKAQKAPKKSPQSSVNKTKGSSNQSVSSGKPGSVLFKAQSKPLKAAPPGPSKPPPLAEIKSKLAAAVKEGKPMPKTEQKFENFAKSSFKLSDAKVVKDLWSFIQTLKGKK